MDTSDAAAELSAEYNSLSSNLIWLCSFLSNYCYNAAAVALFYEYFITISEEVKYFWKRKLTGASILFFLNRYLPLTFSRAFALTNRNWTMAFLVGSLSLVPVVINLIPAHYGVTGENIPLTGCVANDSTPPDVAKSLLILITWSSLFRKHARFHPSFGAATLAEVLLRDVTSWDLSVTVPALQNTSDMTTFTEPITAILVQRFIFHLQAANHRTLGLDSSQMGTAAQWSSSLTFNRIIGSLGASIPPENFLGLLEDDMGMAEDEREGERGSQLEDI
ncbi:hypothetical protein V8D89_004942 [Ganoderma adspersum]